jgi:hypothetical protein
MQDSPKDPDKSGINLVCCNNEKDLARYNVDKIAHELFGKDVPRMFPIYLVFYHGKLRGYLQMIQQLVVYPALHPDKMSPKELIRISRSLTTEIKRMSGNPIFMLCQKSELFKSHTKTVRLKKAEEVAYIYDEEAK